MFQENLVLSEREKELKGQKDSTGNIKKSNLKKPSRIRIRIAQSLIGPWGRVGFWLDNKSSFRSFYVLIYCLRERVSIVRKTKVRNHRREANSPSAKFKFF